jgi:hypothetical protein
MNDTVHTDYGVRNTLQSEGVQITHSNFVTILWGTHHRGPSQPNYCGDPGPGTPTGSTPMFVMCIILVFMSERILHPNASRMQQFDSKV